MSTQSAHSLRDFPLHRKVAYSLRRKVIACVISIGAAGGVVVGVTGVASAAPVEPWDRVAACESGGSWSVSTGNGFSGGLQFTPSTWKEFGGSQYAPQANKATKAEQIIVAKRVLAKQGPGAWPVCSKKAGLVS